MRYFTSSQRRREPKSFPNFISPSVVLARSIGMYRYSVSLVFNCIAIVNVLRKFDHAIIGFNFTLFKVITYIIIHKNLIFEIEQFVSFHFIMKLLANIYLYCQHSWKVKVVRLNIRYSGTLAIYNLHSFVCLLVCLFLFLS